MINAVSSAPPSQNNGGSNDDEKSSGAAGNPPQPQQGSNAESAKNQSTDNAEPMAPPLKTPGSMRSGLAGQTNTEQSVPSTAPAAKTEAKKSEPTNPYTPPGPNTSNSEALKQKVNGAVPQTSGATSVETTPSAPKISTPNDAPPNNTGGNDGGGNNAGENNNNAGNKNKRSFFQRFSPKMVIGAVLLIILVLGSGAGLYLSQRSQDIRQQADTVDCGSVSLNQCESTDGCTVENPIYGDVEYLCSNLTDSQCHTQRECTMGNGCEGTYTEVELISGSCVSDGSGGGGDPGDGTDPGSDGETTPSDSEPNCSSCVGSCGDNGCSTQCDENTNPRDDCGIWPARFQCEGRRHDGCNELTGTPLSSDPDYSNPDNWCKTYQFDSNAPNSAAAVVFVGDNGEVCREGTGCNPDALDWDCNNEAALSCNGVSGPLVSAQNVTSSTNLDFTVNYGDANATLVEICFNAVGIPGNNWVCLRDVPPADFPAEGASFTRTGAEPAANPGSHYNPTRSDFSTNSATYYNQVVGALAGVNGVSSNEILTKEIQWGINVYRDWARCGGGEGILHNGGPGDTCTAASTCSGVFAPPEAESRTYNVTTQLVCPDGETPSQVPKEMFSTVWPHPDNPAAGPNWVYNPSSRNGTTNNSISRTININDIPSNINPNVYVGLEWIRGDEVPNVDLEPINPPSGPGIDTGRFFTSQRWMYRISSADRASGNLQLQFEAPPEICEEEELQCNSECTPGAIDDAGNDECGIALGSGYSCINNRCRLTANPSSSSCEAPQPVQCNNICSPNAQPGEAGSCASGLECTNVGQSDETDGSIYRCRDPQYPNEVTCEAPAPMCAAISMEPSEPQINDQVTFTCATVQGATGYSFRITPPTADEPIALESNGNRSVPYTITESGSYTAQCFINIPDDDGGSGEEPPGDDEIMCSNASDCEPLITCDTDNNYRAACTGGTCTCVLFECDNPEGCERDDIINPPGDDEGGSSGGGGGGIDLPEDPTLPPSETM